MTPVTLKKPAAPAGPAALPPESLRALERHIEREIRRMLRTVEHSAASEAERGGDVADLAATLLEREMDSAVRARCVDGLAEWTEALKRLRETPESFGICIRCQQPIPEARLEILPTSRTCVDC